ncbi:hypothetical protein Tco_0469457 [Tanacetum coccineum]
MEDPDITMEEYVQVETERARRNGKVYNRETSMTPVIKPVLFRPMGYSISEDPKDKLTEEEPLEELKEEGYLKESKKEADSDLLSDACSRFRPAESGDSCESKVKPKRGPA